MIPKRILSCWMGRGRKSDVFERCIETWHKIHPDWDFIEIDEDTLGGFDDCTYIKSVLERGEFVKATELGRLVGLWRYGGIYLDADVELLRPLDKLRDHEFFIGREDPLTVNGAVIGSVAGGETIGNLLDAFPIHSDGSKKATTYGPVFLTEEINKMLPVVTVFPSSFFYPWHWSIPREQAVIGDAYALHLWCGSWKEQA